jgi:hypothetical protein
VWALRGQGVVSTLAMELHRQSRCWDRRALADLRARLVQLPAVHAGRRRGHLVQHSGPAWVRTLLANFPATKWRAACNAVGKLFGDSAVAEASAATGANSAVVEASSAVAGANSAVAAKPRSLFYRTCHSLLHEAKLPGVGAYSVVSLVRCGCACRFAVDKTRVEVCEMAWSTYIRNMTPTVARMFEDLGVTTLSDGNAMLETVVHAARRLHCSSAAAPYGKISLADVALQACEASCARSVFGEAAKKENPRWRGAAAGMEWFLRRVPANRPALAKFAKSVRLKQCRQRRGAPDSCEDPHSAAVVARAWVSSEPAPLRWPLFGGPHGSADPPCALPPLVCERCGHRMPLGLAGRPFTTCITCTEQLRRARGSELRRKRRRLM